MDGIWKTIRSIGGRVRHRAESRPDPRGLGLRYAVGFAAASAAGALLIPDAVRYLLFVAAIALFARLRYQKRRAELERSRNLEAQLALHRLADTMSRPQSDAELLASALDVIAEASGIEPWIYLRRTRDPDGLAVVTARAVPDAIVERLRRDPPRAGSPDPASRAARTGEVVVAGSRSGDAAPWPEGTSAPGPTPIQVSVPILEDGEAVGVLLCFAPRSQGFAPEDLALARWMASQMAQGLKRRELERRDQLLASYMLGTGEILVGCDADGTVTYVNPAAEKATGAAASALRGVSLDSILHSTEKGDGTSLLDAVRHEGMVAGELWCARADGSRFPVEMTAAADMDGAGTRREIVVVARDVTERRERDRQLRQQRETLEFLNMQLEKANDRLRAADRMKNEFIANTSHELRTPLNAVIGFATLLEQGVHHSSDERAAFARSIRESAEHLLHLINDILDLAKMEAGRLELELEPGDVAVVARAAAQTVESQARRKGLALHVETGDEALPVRMDPARMRQVLLNLLGNAIKFTDKGEVRVRAWMDPDAREVRLCVQDSGIGIAKEKQALLFQKFSQVDGSYRRRHQGAGLGLTITRSLVERMHGSVAIESEGLGKGTRVTLSFPADAGSGGDAGTAGSRECHATS